MYEALIAHLRECAKLDASNNTYTEAADAIEELQADKASLNGTVTNLLEQIKNLGKPSWIPVTERLPFDGGKYLCKIKCPKGEWIEIDRWDGEDWYSTDWHEEKATAVVTHWMPLPEPPKEE